MLERTEENAMKLKEKYMKPFLEDKLKEIQETEIEVARLTAILAGKDFDPEDPGIQLTKEIPEEEKMRLLKAFDFSNASNHPVDRTYLMHVMPYIEDMAELEYEEFRIIKFDTTLHVIGVESATDHSKRNISQGTILPVLLDAAKDYRAMGVVIVHNHPFFPATFPSDSDGHNAMRVKMLMNLAGKKLIDDCIIGPMDFYSRRIDEETNPSGTNRVIHQDIIAEDLLDQIAAANIHLANLIDPSYMFKK